MTRILNPEDIEAESFRIIEEEIGSHNFTTEQFPIVRRIIHATADFDFTKNTVFHLKAIASGVAAIRAGGNIVVDVEMIRAGVSKEKLKRFGGEVLCYMSDPDVVKSAKEAGVTRAIMSMRKAAELGRGTVFAVGNAPTALLEICALLEQKKIQPALVIGVPVGFVSAADAKEELLKHETPYIVTRGRKGGSIVTVAIVNALIRLAEEQE